MSMKELSDDPAEALEQAIEDLEATERDPRYHVAMYTWHMPNQAEGRCVVCFAGSVMAKRFGVGCGLERRPTDFDEATEHKLLGLDAARQGSWRKFLKAFGIENMDLACDLYEYVGRPKQYHEDAEGFKAAMYEAVTILRMRIRKPE